MANRRGPASGISAVSLNLGRNGPPGAADGGALYSMVYDSAISRTGAVTIVNLTLAGSVGGSDVVSTPYTSAGTNLGTVISRRAGQNLQTTSTNSGGVSPTASSPTRVLAPSPITAAPTPTMLPLPGSPAIDAGDSKFATATDQRGQPRIAGAPDLGAVGNFPARPFSPA